MIRKWEFVSGFNEYMVTDRGEVFRRSLVKPSIRNGGGYAIISLSQTGRKISRTVHKIVLEAFIGKAPPNCVAHHLDGNRLNNALDNLQWITRSEHGRIHPSSKGGRVNHKDIACDDPWRGERVWNSKLTAEKVRQIRLLWTSTSPNYTIYQLAKMFDVTESTISKVINRKSWQHVV